MKILVHKETKESRFAFNDSDFVRVTDEITFCTDFNIADMNSINSILVENVTLPEDWYAGKYLYDAGTWTINPKWVDPT